MNKLSICDTWLIVLSGGSGSRLHPLTDNLSKSIVPFINHYPVTELVLYGLVKELGLKNVIFSAKGFVNYRDLKSFYGGGSGWSAKLGLETPVSFEYQDPNFEDNGSADGVLYNLNRFRINSPVLVIANDGLFSMKDIRLFCEFAINSPYSLSIGLTHVDNPSLYGIADFNSETSQIRSFIEKPKPGEETSCLANGAIYFIKPDVFIDLEGDFAKNTIPKLTKQDKVGGYVLKERWLDTGTLKTFLDSFLAIIDAPFDYIENFLNQISIKGNKKRIWIRGTGRYSEPIAQELKERIERGDVVVTGRVIIGKDCVIGDNVHLSNCSIGDSSTIGDDCVISKSNIMDAVSVGPRSLIKYSIIGRGASIEKDSKLSRVCVGHGNKSSDFVPI